MVMNAELDRLRAEVASLKEERDEHEKHDAARDEKIRILTTYHGLGCACSYDSVDDVCEHHSPKLMALTQQLAAANGRVEKQAQVIAEALHELDSSAVDWDSPILRASQLLQAEVDAALSNLNEDRDKSDV
jgi:phage tail protein X